MFKKSIKISYFLLVALGLFFSTACKKNDNSLIGLNLLPGSDKMDLLCDTLDINFFTLNNERIAITEKTLTPFGSYFDDIFGVSNASFATQVKIAVSNAVFSNVDESSLKLQLQLRLFREDEGNGIYKDAIYGDPAAIINVKIHKLLTDLAPDKTYYSDHKFATTDYQYYETKELQYSKDSSIVYIDLPTDWAKEFVKSENSKYFEDDTKFKEFFKGIYLTTDNVESSGAIYCFGLTDERSKMILTYYNTDSKENETFEFLFDSKQVLVKMFEHDYTKADDKLREAIGNTQNQQNYFYTQGLAGVKTKINFPKLESIFNSERIAVNRARLTIYLNENSGSTFAPPMQLTFMKEASDGSIVFVNDQVLNTTVFGGQYNSKENSYTFNLTAHFQELVNIENKNTTGIYLEQMPSRNQGTPHRAIFYGNADPTKKPKLELFYSKF